MFLRDQTLLLEILDNNEVLKLSTLSGWKILNPQGGAKFAHSRQLISVIAKNYFPIWAD